MSLAPFPALARRLPWLLIALSLAHSLLYLALTPPWQGPDEPRHFQYVQLMRDLGRVPSAADARAAVGLQSDVYRSLTEQRFWELREHRSPPAGENPDAAAASLEMRRLLLVAPVEPPLFYALCGVFLRPFRSASMLTQLYVLRLWSAVFGAVLVGLAYVAAGSLWPADRRPRALAALFVVFLPMQAFMSGVFNSDGLADLWAAGVFAFLVWIGLRGGSPVRWVGLTACLALAVATKRTTLFLVPLVALSLWWIVPGPIRHRRAWWWLALAGGVCGVAVGGTLLATSGSMAAWSTLEPLRTWIASSQPTLVAVVVHFSVSVMLQFASFWADFGWMNVPLDVGWYAGLAVLSLVALAGWVRFGRRARRGGQDSAAAWTLWRMVTLAAVLVVLQSIALMVVRNRPQQGRYLFTAIVPLAIAFTAGLLEWIPDRARPAFGVAWVVVLAGFDLVCVVGYALPFFYA